MIVRHHHHLLVSPTMWIVTQALFSRERLQTTPARLRTWSVVLSVLLGVAALLGVLAAQDLTESASEIRDNIGPVAIETQGLVASIAEADAASTSVFLSSIDDGVEDRQQRGLYERAIARAPRQIESISARLPVDDPARESLQSAGSQLTAYAGAVERARVRNSEGLADATDDLQDALLLAGGDGGMLGNVGLVNSLNQQRLETGVSASLVLVFVAAGVLVLSIAVLLFAQFRLRRLTKRALNPGLLVATLAAAGATIWLLFSSATMVAALQSAAENGYDSIELIGQVQTEAFAFRTNEALAVIGAEPFTQADRELAIARVDELLVQTEETADTRREVASIDIVQSRWARYVETSTSIASELSQGDTAAARTLAIEESNDDFNGFNTTLEAALLSNRDQFDLGVDQANGRLQWLIFGMALLPLLGVAFVLAGYQPRINEYW